MEREVLWSSLGNGRLRITGVLSIIVLYDVPQTHSSEECSWLWTRRWKKTCNVNLLLGVGRRSETSTLIVRRISMMLNYRNETSSNRGRSKDTKKRPRPPKLKSSLKYFEAAQIQSETFPILRKFPSCFRLGEMPDYVTLISMINLSQFIFLRWKGLSDYERTKNYCKFNCVGNEQEALERIMKEFDQLNSMRSWDTHQRLDLVQAHFLLRYLFDLGHSWRDEATFYSYFWRTRSTSRDLLLSCRLRYDDGRFRRGKWRISCVLGRSDNSHHLLRLGCHVSIDFCPITTMIARVFSLVWTTINLNISYLQ